MKQSLVWNAALLLLAMITYHLFAEPLSFRFSLISVVLFVIGYLLLIVLHELFHLLGFLLFGRVPFSSLAYGLNVKMGVAYATTDRPLRVRAMRKALLLPFWVTGVLPGVIGFMVPSQLLVLLSTMLIAGAAGDFAMYRELRNVPADAWVTDDQAKPRLYVYEQDFPPEKTSAG
ncbi:hypothetical protein B0X71_18650 [Planococcus lenghuensis]|uniref:DUF3267 domain-containing protein n=2 Tax=Planococcus lenghuensis TaxID=2213202 RepID=A0A1Q2L546_9BACL|nr:hypothetical protein B0X71_18650 [Planococcus lenghuensis]